MTDRGALSGIRVVELTSYVSGPYAGMLLADFGAEVIKIEPPEKGDPFRGWGTLDNPFFRSVNRNKKSVALDLKTPAGVAAARRLIDRSDVVIENYRTGALDRLGLGYDELRKQNARLIYCSITGFGNFGPYAQKPGYDTIGQAMGGLLGLLTDTDDPKPMGVSVSDHLAGLVACNGILAALCARDKTGKGQRVDTSLLESTVSFIGENATRFLEDRIKNYDALHAELSAVFRSGRREHWLRLLEREDVPACPINDLAEVFSDPQVQALGLVARVPHPKHGYVEVIRNGVRLSDTPTSVHSSAPELGQHNSELVDPTETS
jgi:formyl-CoA transferase